VAVADLGQARAMSWIVVGRVKRDRLAFVMLEGVKVDDLHVREFATEVEAEHAIASFDRPGEDDEDRILDYQIIELKI
jgi:hypothetical protein